MKMNWAGAGAALIVVLLQVFAIHHAAEAMGVNWGTQASQNLHPNTVIQILKDNKINKIKLFDSDPWTVNFFARTGIEVILGVPNNQLQDLADSYDNAVDWVKENLTQHLHDGGVNIKFDSNTMGYLLKNRPYSIGSGPDGYVALGNEPFLKSYNGSLDAAILPALKNMQKAINEEGFGDKVKATIPQNADVYDSGSSGPSAGNFRSDIRDTMIQIVRFLQDNNAPFVVNIYPFLSLYENQNFPVAYAFFDGGATPVQDKGTSYTNMVDANLDTLVYSLKKAGAGKVKIIIGEIGWPTDGHQDATPDMSKKFYDGLLRKMASKKGTPMYPGEIEYYLFSLTDENMKSIAPGDFERHWGIFRYDGQPKFPMDFTGKGNDRMPVGAKNVQYQSSKWCVLDPEMTNAATIAENMNFACSRADCTTLNHASSCTQMDPNAKISYAFNIYFQMNNQDVESCDFEGLAKIVEKNASNNQCLFPLALKSSAWRRRINGVIGTCLGLLALVLLVC